MKKNGGFTHPAGKIACPQPFFGGKQQSAQKSPPGIIIIAPKEKRVLKGKKGLKIKGPKGPTWDLT